MKKRLLGRNGPEVSAMGLGCMSIGIADVYTIGAVDVVLTAQDLKLLDEAAPKGAVTGDRYSPGMMQLVNT